jgi:hypothetical protein
VCSSRANDLFILAVSESQSDDGQRVWYVPVGGRNADINNRHQEKVNKTDELSAG